MARRILALLVLAVLTHVVLANAVIRSVRDLKRALLEPAPGTSAAVGLQLTGGEPAAFPRREARLDCAMASAHESDASECIGEETCLPIGGHSVWAVLGKGAAPSTPPPNDSVVLLCSAFGARTLAPGASRGVDAALSGSVAALLAAKIVGHALTALAQPPAKQVAVALWAGQEWGHLGVRRLLWDLHRTSDFAEARRRGTPAPPMRPEALHALLAVGAVGSAVRAGNATTEPARLFVHRHATDLQREDLSQALMRAGGATGGRAHVTRPLTFAAHPPPSAADPLVGRRAALQAAVLSQDDAVLAGADLDSWTDGLDAVSPVAVARAAEVAARGVWELVAGGAALPGSLVDPGALETEAAALMQCLATAWPGLDCPLGRRLASRTQVAVAHGYLGALRSAAALREDGGAAQRSDFERFAHAYLALAAGGVDPEALDEEDEEGRCRVGAEGKKSPCERGEVCVAERNYPGLKGKGWCLSVQAGFVEAYSTALEYNASAPDHKWTVSAEAQPWEAEAGWPVDALWVESYWPQGVPSASFFTAEAAGLQSTVLWSGFAAVAAFILAAVGLEKAHGARRRGVDV